MLLSRYFSIHEIIANEKKDEASQIRYAGIALDRVVVWFGRCLGQEKLIIIVLCLTNSVKPLLTNFPLLPSLPDGLITDASICYFNYETWC